MPERQRAGTVSSDPDRRDHRVPARIRKGSLTLLFAAGLLVLSGSPSRAEDLMAWGHTIAMGGNGLPGNTACAECHRINGGGMPSVGIPRIAGQTETYIYREIRGVQKKIRYSPYMAGVVANLSPRDIRAVALYYSAMKTPKLPDPAPFDPQLSALGRKIAHRGLWDRNIPACILCHGRGGRGVPPNFPYIAGQSKTYLMTQLISFAVLDRSDDPEGLMRGIASKLTTREIKAVAQYFASLDPPVLKNAGKNSRPDRLRLIPQKEPR